MLTKYGFGTAGYLGDVRPRGSKISVGGKSLGVVPIIQGVQHDMEYVALPRQSRREGVGLRVSPLSHGDFDEVCTYLEQHPDGNNIGWVGGMMLTQKMKEGDQKLSVSEKILRTKMITGKGVFLLSKIRSIVQDRSGMLIRDWK